MSEIINCPECGYAIELDKAMAEKGKANFEKELAKRLLAEKTKLNEAARFEVASLQEKLDKANANELQLRRQKTELEQRTKEMDLEVQRRLDEEKGKLENQIVSRIVEDHRAKDAEKDKKLADTLSQVEDLKRRMEQGSQQAQGETLEAEMEDMLRNEFPLDVIDPVSPGVKGGDILHTVKTRAGIECGKILWEIKRTKTWSDAWTIKVKSDARNCKADVCLIATEALPKGILNSGRMLGEYDSVWVSSPGSCIPLAHAIRQGLIRAAKEKYVQAGKQDKAALVYDYLTGVEFKGRVEALIACWVEMRSNLNAEKTAMEKVWARREKQLSIMTSSLAGMHGEIEAIAAGELPAIAALQIGEGK